MRTVPAEATREAWLADAVRMLRVHFKARGYTVPPNIKVSVSWPSKAPKKSSGPYT